MLEFKLNNKPFLLDNSARIRLNWKNPACVIDSFPGDAGLGISIPVNDHNRSLLGNPERFEKYTKSGDREFTGFEVRYDGYRLMTGTLVVQQATNKMYNAWLRSPLGNLGKEQREKNINDLDWKKQQSFVNKKIYSKEDGYAAPQIINQVFWEGKGKIVEDRWGYRNRLDDPLEMPVEIEELTLKFKDNRFHVNWYYIDKIMTNPGAVVTPMLFLDYVVMEMLRMSGWFIRRNDWADDENMQNLILYNNFNIMYPEIETQVTVDEEWDELNQQWVPATFNRITSVLWKVGKFDYRDLIPRVKMKDFVLGLQNYINYVFHFRDDKIVNIIDRNAIPDRNPIDLDKWFVNEWEIGDRVSRQLKFTSEFDENDGLQGDGWVDLSDRIGDFKEPVLTYTELTSIANPEIGELRFVERENKVYEYKWTVFAGKDEKLREYQQDVLAWEFISTGPQPYLFGNNEFVEEINTCFSTLVMDYKTTFISTPAALQHGNISTMRSVWNDFSPRLLFYRDTGIAHIDNGYVSLNWGGEKGLINKRWNKWARLWKDRLPVNAEFDLPLNVIDYVKNNIYEPFSTKKGKFIIEEMEVEINLNTIGTTNIKGYKV